VNVLIVFFVGTFGELVGRLDQDSTVRQGRQFELICQWFLAHCPTYGGQLRRIWLWNEWPGRWGIDAGIDLVAEDHDGLLWAIQAKCYDPRYRVTKKDVNTFLAEAGRPLFAYRLLIATTNRVDKLANRTIQGQGSASFIGLSDLEAAELNWPSSPARLTVTKPVKPKTPRPHQRAAINDVIKGFQSADRGQLIMACGTGKTLAALFIKDKLNAERTLVLLPSLSLLKQTLREWTTNKSFEFRAVCSDDTVVDVDAAVSHASDLGVPVTTNPADIAGFLRRRTGPRVVFATYQSSPQVAKAYELDRVPGFDLVVADEAHRCAGAVSSDFATVLDATQIKAKRRLFMTATPRYFTGRVVRESKEADYEIASMDNEAVFGTVFHQLPFGEAIQRDLLTDYQVVIIGVDDAIYRAWAERAELVILDGDNPRKTDARTLAGQIGLATAMRKYDLHRTITFHSRVNRAREFARSMPKIMAWMPARQRPKGVLWADYASGEMTAGERVIRVRNLAQLENGERGLLANARCLAEGVDVPTLDGVAFIDPRRSEVDIVQAVGRAIRKSEDKTVGTIVIPVFIDTDQDHDTALDDSAFKPVWDVIKALRSHDEQLGEDLDELRRALGRRQGRIELPTRIHVDVPTTVGADFGAAFGVRLVEDTTTTWEFIYGVLQGYAEQHGHARVPVSHVENGIALGRWVNKQRTGRYSLGEAKRRSLEQIPGWAWDARGVTFMRAYEVLQLYVEREGTARVRQSHVECGFKLGTWVNTQRQQRDKLPAERRSLLEALPEWSWTPIEDSFDANLNLLTAFGRREGHTRVPQSHVEDGQPLGKWVNKQRSRRARIASDRQAQLEALPGWTWSTRDDDFDDALSALRSYALRLGHTQIPATHKENGVYLGRWVAGIRKRRHELADDERVRFEAVPHWTWDTADASFDRRFGRLEAYAQRHGHARVPQKYQDGGVNLGVWVARLRQRREQLPETHKARLESLPGWAWDGRIDTFDENLTALRSYAQREGHSRVPKGHCEGALKLGIWVAGVRRKKDRLSDSQRARLEELSDWTWDTYEADFQRNLELLRGFVEREGHARVPQSHREIGVNLGTWVATQRVNRDRLEPRRRAQLEAVSGWLWEATIDTFPAKLALLRNYAAREGHARVPQRHVEDGVNLGTWVATQRKRRHQLDPAEHSALEAIPGWTWDPFGDVFDRNLNALRSFSYREGHTRVPRGYIEDGADLGSWVIKQRHKMNDLDDTRRSQLESVPEWTWSTKGRAR
jgi:superfamily II DNA or RNA helicase